MMARGSAALWAVWFALVHAYWIAGGSVGLPPPVVAARPAGLMFAAAVAVPLLLLAGLAAIIDHGRAGGGWRRVAAIGTATTALFALTHAIAQLAVYTARAMAGTLERTSYVRYDLALYEPNWLVGGTLFLLAWREQRVPTAGARLHD